MVSEILSGMVTIKKAQLAEKWLSTMSLEKKPWHGMAWHGSTECMKRVHELEDLGREKFGKDHWMKWGVSYFWTTAVKDQP